MKKFNLFKILNKILLKIDNWIFSAKVDKFKLTSVSHAQYALTEQISTLG